MPEATLKDLIDDLSKEGNLVPCQLHAGLRLLGGLCFQGKYGKDDLDIAGWLKKYQQERLKD